MLSRPFAALLLSLPLASLSPLPVPTGLSGLSGAAHAAAGARTPDVAVQPGPRLTRMLELLRIEELLEILREEGIDYARLVRAEMFPEIAAGPWDARIARIYDVTRMRGLIETGFAAKGGDQDAEAGTTIAAPALEQAVEFFSTDLGQRITRLEIDARRAMLDEMVERQAAQDYARVMEEEPARQALLEEFVAANDLIESNVVGGMNSNYAFYSGLLDGGAFPFDVSEEQVLSDVWSQEDEIRSESEIWIYSYLNLAYQPLSNAEMGDYVAFSRSDAGRAFNRALFDAFDLVFNTMSYDLGRAAGNSLRGEEL
ncbi:uncharacterized protein DUF2059 [Brevirhabdus pacifica]|nr:DUF2059 domain-containing protein [Brevirhabdus pacifica]PJJ86977.1 uncharacterized protein DUF2059 [Brevirhabdus pacifica]